MYVKTDPEEMASLGRSLIIFILALLHSVAKEGDERLQKAVGRFSSDSSWTPIDSFPFFFRQ